MTSGSMTKPTAIWRFVKDCGKWDCWLLRSPDTEADEVIMVKPKRTDEEDVRILRILRDSKLRLMRRRKKAT